MDVFGLYCVAINITYTIILNKSWELTHRFYVAGGTRAILAKMEAA